MKASTAPWSHMRAQGRGGVPPGWGDPEPEEHLFRLVEGSGSGDMRVVGGRGWECSRPTSSARHQGLRDGARTQTPRLVPVSTPGHASASPSDDMGGQSAPSSRLQGAGCRMS